MDNDFFKRRLIALYKAFDQLEIDITGLPQKPLIIYDEYKLLRLKLDGPLIHFLDEEHKPVHTFNISGLSLEPEFMESYVDRYGYKPVFRLKHPGADLYVAGFDYKIREGALAQEGKYPVFGRHKLRYYFSEEEAQEVINEFEIYDLMID